MRKEILGKEVVIHTVLDKSGKYGRLLGLILPDGVEAESLNERLVRKGLARVAEY